MVAMNYEVSVISLTLITIENIQINLLHCFSANYKWWHILLIASGLAAIGMLGSTIYEIINQRVSRNKTSTVVPGFKVLGFSALPGFSALKAGDGAWSVH